MSARGPAWQLARALACVLWCASMVGRVQAEETCVQCHREQRDPRLRAPTEELPASVHGKKGVTCSDCHRGRPDEPTIKAHDVSRGFRARAAAGNPEAVCGTCHADAKRMAEDDPKLPTDQLELYKASVHGLAFARGEKRAATCAACHGSHAVRKVSDPDASVNPRNVAATCGHCHSNAQLMADVKLPHDAQSKWRRSVHGERHAAWIASRTSSSAEGERHPPTCNDCHKDHAVGPRDRAISGCEGCHKEEWRSFQAGPHAEAFKRMGFLPCVDCHGNHEIFPVNAGLIGVDHEAACLRCHAEGQSMFEDIRKLSIEVRAAEAAADRVREAQSGVPLATVAARLAPIDEAQRALRIVVHTLDLEKIAAAAQALGARAAETPSGAAQASDLLEQARPHFPVIVLLLVAALAFLLAARRGPGGQP